MRVRSDLVIGLLGARVFSTAKRLQDSAQAASQSPLVRANGDFVLTKIWFEQHFLRAQISCLEELSS